MILTGLLFLPVFFLIPIFLLKKEQHLKVLGLILSLVHLLYGVFVCFQFDFNQKTHQMVELVSLFKPLGVYYSLGVDGLSLLLIGLSLFLMPLIVLGTWNSIRFRVRTYFINLFLLQICMIGTFLSLDLVLFYIFFEASLIPMLFLMGLYGGKERIFAAKKFFIFTLFGSVFLLGSIITMMVLFESVNGNLSSLMTDFQLIEFYFVKSTIFSTQTVLFFGFLIAFSVKAALFPLHTWLPDFHVEAPTGGSVILGSLMLKMGAYGMIRFLGIYFPQASEQYSWIVCVLALIGVVYGAMIAFVQTDIKKLIAYSSVSQMGYIILGIFCWNSVAHIGASFQMISHGLSVAAFFLMTGLLYERFKTRDIKNFGGLSKTMPKFTICFLLVAFSSVAVPLTSGFVGEFLILRGAFTANKYYSVFAILGVFLTAAYMLNMIKRLCFEPISKKHIELEIEDLSKREICVLLPIIILIFVMGVYPSIITGVLDIRDKPLVEKSLEEGEYVAR